MVFPSVYGFGGQSGLLTVLSRPPFARKYKEEETMMNEVLDTHPHDVLHDCNGRGYKRVLCCPNHAEINVNHNTQLEK